MSKTNFVKLFSLKAKFSIKHAWQFFPHKDILLFVQTNKLRLEISGLGENSHIFGREK